MNENLSYWVFLKEKLETGGQNINRESSDR